MCACACVALDDGYLIKFNLCERVYNDNMFFLTLIFFASFVRVVCYVFLSDLCYYCFGHFLIVISRRSFGRGGTARLSTQRTIGSVRRPVISYVLNNSFVFLYMFVVNLFSILRVCSELANAIDSDESKVVGLCALTFTLRNS